MSIRIFYIDGTSEEFVISEDCWMELDDVTRNTPWIRLYGDDVAEIIRTDTIRRISG